jgi:alpha-tubulin suppressor-like RCC1 family protein
MVTNALYICSHCAMLQEAQKLPESPESPSLSRKASSPRTGTSEDLSMSTNFTVASPVRCRYQMKSISAGSRHSIALSVDGAVFCWGWGMQGQLGLGHCNTALHPTRVKSLSSVIVVEISAGGIHSGCIDKDGTCYMWGSSEYGQLGRGLDVKLSSVPIVLCSQGSSSALPLSKISCGGMHTAAIDLEGNLWTWGRADSGQTGTEKWIFDSFPGVPFPTRVPGLSEAAVAVSCGGFHTVVLTSLGKAYSMGKEDFGVLGTGTESSSKMKAGTEILTEIKALSGLNIVGVSCGGWHSVFWSNEGLMYVCGKGEYGRLGTGSESSTPIPRRVDIPGDVKVVSASAGGSHTLILSQSGTVYSVGRGDDGRLGLGPVANPKVSVPALVPLEAPGRYALKATEVKAGGAHSLFIMGMESSELSGVDGNSETVSLIREGVDRNYSFSDVYA